MLVANGHHLSTRAREAELQPLKVAGKEYKRPGLKSSLFHCRFMDVGHVI